VTSIRPRTVSDGCQVCESFVFGFALVSRTEGCFGSRQSQLSRPPTLGMTWRLGQDGILADNRTGRGLCNRPQLPLNSVERNHGAFLRSVSFLPKKTPKGT
jgi:hypothetical protein